MRKPLPLLLLFFIFSIPGLYASQEAENIIPGQMLVKLNPSFAYLNADGKSMRSRQWKALVPSLEITATLPLAAAVGAVSKKNARTAQASDVDIRLYHQLSFDPGLSVQHALDLLYKSGVVALAEPLYAAVPFSYTANDPQLSNQYYLELIKAYEGWSLSKGSENVVIAIIDTGIDLTHPDLAANIFLNEADPIDGIDNDGDGFVDNYYGWDFAGSDYRTLIGDNDPATTQVNANHGTKVAGCASAITNNGVGIAGVSLNARIMALKHVADNDTRYHGKGYLLNTIQGVLYAATHGAHIINASYGSGFYSRIEQDIYKLVATEYNVLIVAAAGNSNTSAPNYPSGYPQVLSVAASTQQDQKAAFSNFGYGVDLAAPGSQIYSTTVAGGYENGTGTSFSAPLVSGAAALLKSKYPHFSGLQLGQLLRVSADPAFLKGLDQSMKDKMGAGRLDIARAMSYEGPAIRAENVQLVSSAAAGNIRLITDFKNYLWPSPADLTVSLSALTDGVSVLESALVLGVLHTDEVRSTRDKPFKLLVSDSLPANYKVLLKLEFSAGDYKDVQYITVRVNQSYIDLDENKLATTISANGRIGYEDGQQEHGQGLVFRGTNMLYEMGVIMAAAGGKVVNNVRSKNGVDADFAGADKISKALPGLKADAEVWGSFNDSGDTLNRLHVLTDYRVYSWQQAPHDQSLVLVYSIKNKGAQPLENYYFGLFADWDISTGSYRDKADWDSLNSLGYVYTADPQQSRVAGVQLLSENPAYWAIDNDHKVAGNPFGIYDGFTDEEKFKAVSSGIGRKSAGLAERGSDVSHTVGSGPYTIAAGDSVVIAFALHAGTSLAEIQAAARHTRLLYKQMMRTDDTHEEPPGGEEVTGIEDQEIKDLKVFPNPTSGQISVTMPHAVKDPIRLRVLDASGRQLKGLVYPGDHISIQLWMPQKPGLYLLEITHGNKRATRRIVVQ